MVPEQRVLRIARIGPEQVANVTASEQEIAAYYNANQATYAAKETRNLSQAVVPDQATANAIAARAKAGARSPRPRRGECRGHVAPGPDRQAYAAVAGDKAAARRLRRALGDGRGPIQSDFGWVVVKVDLVKTRGRQDRSPRRAPKSPPSSTRTSARQAIEDLVDKVQNAVDEGSNFAEAAAQAKLPVDDHAADHRSGASRADPNYKLPAELAPAREGRVRHRANDPPEIVTLPTTRAMCWSLPAQVVPAAPAPLARIREQVASDWIDDQATSARRRRRRRDRRQGIAQGMPLAQAVKEAGVPLPPVQPLAARRIQIAMAEDRCRRRCSCCSRSLRARAGWSPTRRAAAFSLSR